MSWYDYEYSGPRRVKGGIRAQSKRGSFGTTWWGRRWIETLERFDIGARLSRGRSYARGGQVLSIEIEQGCVNAKVQGSRPTPYRITIRMEAYSSATWSRIIQALREQPFFAAKLLAGEMPPDVEQVFAREGLSLFPKRGSDLQTDCSCPDWSIPCKHIAAVYYLLAEEFDRDPFLLFRLRGVTRDVLLDEIMGGLRTETHTGSEMQTVPPEPITPGARFWKEGPLPEDSLGTVRTPPVSAALPKRLGGFPFWQAEEPLLEALDPIYSKASSLALNLLLRRPVSR